MTRAIVASTYRYKRPPRKRAKATAIEAPAIVTIDPKTRVAKKGRRRFGREGRRPRRKWF